MQWKQRGTAEVQLHSFTNSADNSGSKPVQITGARGSGGGSGARKFCISFDV